MDQSPSQSKDVFNEFLGKFVKVVYSDGSQTAIMKGTITNSDDGFLFVQGDFCQKIISKKNIQKVEVIK